MTVDNADHRWHEWIPISIECDCVQNPFNLRIEYFSIMACVRMDIYCSQNSPLYWMAIAIAKRVFIIFALRCSKYIYNIYNVCIKKLKYIDIAFDFEIQIIQKCNIQFMQTTLRFFAFIRLFYCWNGLSSLITLSHGWCVCGRKTNVSSTIVHAMCNQLTAHAHTDRHLAMW